MNRILLGVKIGLGFTFGVILAQVIIVVIVLLGAGIVELVQRLLGS